MAWVRSSAPDWGYSKMPVYPPSPFESAVGGFLQGYNTTSGIRQRKQEAALQKRQADRADQLAQVQLGQQGYDVLQMPKVEAPPDQNLFQKVGFWLQHRNDEPQSIVMKTHPSVHETDVQNQESFAREQAQAGFSNQRAIEELRAAISAKELAAREAGADRRNREDNATSIRVAEMNNAPRQQQTALEDKHAFIDDALAAAGGNALTAIHNVASNPKLLARAQALGLNRFDYAAGEQRFGDRKAQLSRETIQSREDIAGSKNANSAAFRNALLGPQGQQQGADPSTMSDADAWEYYVNHGMTPAQATAQVNARRKQ